MKEVNVIIGLFQIGIALHLPSTANESGFVMRLPAVSLHRPPGCPLGVRV